MWETLTTNLNKHITLTPEETTIITSVFTTRKFRKKQYVLQEGDVTRHETLIVSGLTRTYEVDEKGSEHIIQFGMENWWVGDLYSFLSGTPSVYNIDCIEDTEVLQVTKENLEILYERVPKIERYFRILVQNAFIASTRRVSSALTLSATERYNEFVARYPETGQRVADHHIASYLGITPQSLSRIRANATLK